MPKINVYVSQEIHDWIAENDVSQSAEFQARIAQLRAGEVDAADSRDLSDCTPKKIAYVRVDADGNFDLKPTQTVVGHHIKGERVTRLVVME